MLVLTRKEGQSIKIGDDILITICRTTSGSVKVGIDAPQDVQVLRNELLQGSELWIGMKEPNMLPSIPKQQVCTGETATDPTQ